MFSEKQQSKNEMGRDQDFVGRDVGREVGREVGGRICSVTQSQRILAPTRSVCFFCVLAVGSVAYSSVNVTWDKNETERERERERDRNGLAILLGGKWVWIAPVSIDCDLARCDAAEALVIGTRCRPCRNVATFSLRSGMLVPKSFRYGIGLLVRSPMRTSWISTGPFGTSTPHLLSSIVSS